MELFIIALSVTNVVMAFYNLYVANLNARVAANNLAITLENQRIMETYYKGKANV